MLASMDGDGSVLGRVLSVLDVRDGPDGRGEHLAFCPAHDDRNTPNLRVREGEDGRALLHCFAGCDQARLLHALEERGIHRKDLFRVQRVARRSEAEGCTLEAYAKEKRLPVEYLKGLGVTGISYSGKPALRIPYTDENGDEVSVRIRLSMNKSDERDDRFRWRRGSKATLYGLWRLGRIRDANYVVLVEGESDCHTLWHHGIEALGIPGANTWRDEWTTYLEGVEKAYAIVEPDEGGRNFWRKLSASPGLAEKLYRVELDGAEDVSDLHLRGPDSFKEGLRAAFSRSRRLADDLDREAEAHTRELWKSCKDLAAQDDILDRFADSLRESGVAGETRVVKLLYLALTSRLLEKPVSIAVKGPSSGGKSHLTESVLGFFPDDAYHAITAMSERTLAYSEEPIKHRFLIVYEAAGMTGDFGTYLIRSLLSEGRLRYETVEKTPNGLKARLIEREGPTGLIVTTTAVRLHPENETRLISLTVTDTREQTREVLAAMTGEKKPEVDRCPWLALQGWLASSASTTQVTIPFSQDLAELIPPVAVRLRRDFGAVLNLIRAHAMLHQATRDRDGRGWIVATTGDYGAVRDLVEDLISDGIGATVSPTLRETVAAVSKRHEESRGEPVTITSIASELCLDRSAASRRVRSARDQGYLRDLEDNPRKPSRLVPGDPLPEDLEILPDPERLKACKRAGEPESNAVAPSQNEGGDGPQTFASDAPLHASAKDRRVQFTI